jgi:hypothetical protein
MIYTPYNSMHASIICMLGWWACETLTYTSVILFHQPQVFRTPITDEESTEASSAEDYNASSSLSSVYYIY